MKSERRNSFVAPPAEQNPAGDIEEVGGGDGEGGYYHGGGVDGREWGNMEVVQHMMEQDFTANGDNDGQNNHDINGGTGEYEDGYGGEVTDHDSTTVDGGTTGGNFPVDDTATTDTGNVFGAYLKETQDIVSSKAEMIPLICENVMNALQEYVMKMAEVKAEYERIADAEQAESNRLQTIEMEVDGATSHFLTMEEREAAMALTQTQTQNDDEDEEEEDSSGDDEDFIGAEHESNERDNDGEHHDDHDGDFGRDDNGIGGSGGSDDDDLNDEQNKENIEMNQEEVSVRLSNSIYDRKTNLF